MRRSYLSSSLYVALVYRENTVWSGNKQVLFLHFWQLKPFRWPKARRERLMMTRAAEQMLKAHRCCPLRHRGLLIPSWILRPIYCILLFSSHGNLCLSWQHSLHLVTIDGCHKHWSFLQLLLSSHQNTKCSEYSLRWSYVGTKIFFLLHHLQHSDLQTCSVTQTGLTCHLKAIVATCRVIEKLHFRPHRLNFFNAF